MAIVPHARSTHDVVAASFADVVATRTGAPLRRGPVTTLQVNLGKVCNQACRHCHVDAGPARTERMSDAVAERVLALLAATPSIDTVDLTGGAPELNPSFRRLVDEACRLGRRVIDRCNLTVLFEPGMEDLPEWLAARRVAVTASLPCYGAENVDRQRGAGVFDASIAALRRLNAVGYGRGDGLALDLVYNPVGAALPPPQAELEARYQTELRDRFGIVFDRLLTITNMPIARFADSLARAGADAAYATLLREAFNPATVPALMCRSFVSVAWDGRLFDCDFNQMCEIPLGAGPRTVWDVSSFANLRDAPVATAPHCFGCTAGAGSGCGGALG